MHIFKGRVLFLRRFFYSLFFGKCAHSANDVTQISSCSRAHRARRCVTFLLSFVLLFGMVLPASAEDDVFSVSDMRASMYTETNTGSGINIKNYDYTDGTETRSGILFHWFSAVDRSFYAKGSNKIVSAYDYSNLSAGHEYEITFYTNVNFTADYTVTVKMGLGNVIYEKVVEKTGQPQKFNVKYTAPDAVTNETRLTIEMSFDSLYGYGSNAGDIQVKYMISEVVELTDLTENPSWLGKILNKFNEIKQSFFNLTSSIGSFFDSLGQKISGAFTDLWANIKQKFDDLKQWFKDLGDRISGFFDDLKLKIETTFQAAVDEIKSWFIPSEGYFDRKKEELETFAVEHFGAMYQAPDVIVDLIKKFTTMSPKEPAITFPAIQFDFNGTRYTLSESVRYTFSWVNDKGQAVYYFYHFYRGFVTVILFVVFANYCIKKYNEVFGGGSE